MWTDDVFFSNGMRGVAFIPPMGDAKPQVCKQFPLVATRVDGDLRIGVDPACFSSMRRVITGHELDLERVVVGRVSVSDNEAQLERHLVHFL